MGPTDTESTITSVDTKIYTAIKTIIFFSSHYAFTQNAACHTRGIAFIAEIHHHCSHSLFGLHKHLTSIVECQWVQFLPLIGKFNDTLLLCMKFHVRQYFDRLIRRGKVYCQEGSIFILISPILISDNNQHYKIGGNNFGVTSLPYI